jgi:phosphoserine phosphatase RsbU/P
MNWFNRIKENYKLLTSDLSFSAVENLFKSDAPTLLNFYAGDSQNTGKNRLVRFFFLLKNLAFAFIKKLSPPRRALYLVALYFIVSALFNGFFNSLIAFAIVTLLLAFELADKLTAKDELEVARTIQQSLLPKNPPKHKGYEFAFFTEAAREVGGDFYDFFQNENNSTILIGDISGKGMGAALFMVQVNTILKSLSKNNTLENIVVSFNEKIEHLFPSTIFLTSSFIQMDGDGNIELYRAGHLPFIHYSAKEKKCNELLPEGLGIALGNPQKFKDQLRQQKIKMVKDDILVLYTDGLVETRNKHNEELGALRLNDFIHDNAELSATDIQKAILQNVLLFRGPRPPHDDLTLIVIKAV